MDQLNVRLLEIIEVRLSETAMLTEAHIEVMSYEKTNLELMQKQGLEAKKYHQELLAALGAFPAQGADLIPTFPPPTHPTNVAPTHPPPYTQTTSEHAHSPTTTLPGPTTTFQDPTIPTSELPVHGGQHSYGKLPGYERPSFQDPTIPTNELPGYGGQHSHGKLPGSHSHRQHAYSGEQQLPGYKKQQAYWG